GIRDATVTGVQTCALPIYPKNAASLMEATDDWVQFVIDLPMAHDPGTVFAYSSGATELLAYIFQKDTGQDIEEYAKNTCSHRLRSEERRVGKEYKTRWIRW